MQLIPYFILLFPWWKSKQKIKAANDERRTLAISRMCHPEPAEGPAVISSFLGASLAFSGFLRRLTPPIIWGRSFCGVAKLRLVECIKMVLDNHPVVGNSLRHWGAMNLVKPLKNCHYFGMILQFKGRSLYQIVAKNYFGQMWAWTWKFTSVFSGRIQTAAAPGFSPDPAVDPKKQWLLFLVPLLWKRY